MSTGPVTPLWNSLALDRDGFVSLQDQIVGYFQDAVLSGRLAAGTRVPSSRQLATEHGVARITVVQAYERLAAEGYLVSRPGAGMFVADAVSDHRPTPSTPVTKGAEQGDGGRLPAPARAITVPAVPPGTLPLTAGLPALDHFPWSDWARITGAVQRERPAEALAYGDPGGTRVLREAIAAYLWAARGIACEPEQVIVVAGSQQGIDLTARALAEPGDDVWFEEPGYPVGRAAFQAAGLRVVPVRVDGEGLDVAEGTRMAPSARLALVAPSHQYPLGVTMSLRRRLALLDWAAENHAWIIEDDYDGEYRYGGRPLAPLYTLDAGRRVLYLGTFSKVLAPGLRVGYLVVPPALAGRFAALKAASDRGAPGITQRVLARFIAQGRLAAHVRRMRVLYSRRRDALLGALRAEAGDLLDVSGNPDAGLHLVARLPIDRDDADIARRTLERQVRAAALSTYYVGGTTKRGFVLGFAISPEDRAAAAVRILVEEIRRRV